MLKQAKWTGVLTRNPSNVLTQVVNLLNSKAKLHSRDPRLSALRQPMIHGGEVTRSPSGLSVLADLIWRSRLSKSQGKQVYGSLDKEIQKMLNDHFQDRMKDVNPGWAYPKLGLSAWVNKPADITVKGIKIPQGSVVRDPNQGINHVLARTNVPTVDQDLRKKFEGLVNDALKDPASIGLQRWNPTAYDDRIQTLIGQARREGWWDALQSKGIIDRSVPRGFDIGNANFQNWFNQLG